MNKELYNNVVVAVSGIPGVGKSSFIRMLQAELGFEVFSIGEWFKKQAREKGMDIADYMETVPEEVHRYADTRLVVDEAGKGDRIIDARYSAFTVPKADVKIFLTAPFEVAAERLSNRKQKHCSAEYVKRRWEEESEIARETYGFDLNDMSVYDFVFDTSRVPGPDGYGPLVEKVVNRLREMGRI